MLPDKTVAVLLYLAPHQRASRIARSTPSTLKLNFTIDESAPSTGAVEEVSDSRSWPPGILPSPPPVPAQVVARGRAIFGLILAFWQIVSHLSGSCNNSRSEQKQSMHNMPYMNIDISLNRLGPESSRSSLSTTTACPTSLCWRPLRSLRRHAPLCRCSC